MEIRKIYEYALQREREGKRFFESNAERLSHGAAVDAFRRLAAEEQKHIEIIQHQLDLLDTGEQSSADAQQAAQAGVAGFELFEERAESEMLDQSVAEAMVPDLAVLRMAYLIEHDFVDFYEHAAFQASGDARQVLEALANWERRHEALFRQMHDQAFELYAGMPWGG